MGFGRFKHPPAGLPGVGQNPVLVRARLLLPLVVVPLLAAGLVGPARAEVPPPLPELPVWTPPPSVLNVLAQSPQDVTRALEAADFVMSLVRPSGAIVDFPGAGIANTDSHLQYALMGLGAAYHLSARPRYLEGMRNALGWLGGRQRADGSWWLGYGVERPFKPVRRAWGVSATAGLYIYDLWLYRQLSGDAEWVAKREWRVRRALRFLSTMRAPDGTYYSSWVRAPGGGYVRSTYRFTSDQVDVYLGLRAAAALLGEPRYARMAASLRRALLGTRFYLPGHGRYARGVYPNGRKDTRVDVLTIWPQGYVPWVLGSHSRTRPGVAWLRSKARRDGSVRAWGRDPVYTLSAEVLVMGSVGVDGPATNHPSVPAAATWMSRVARMPDGGLRDSLKREIRFCNVAGFATLAWLRLPAAVP